MVSSYGPVIILADAPSSLGASLSLLAIGILLVLLVVRELLHGPAPDRSRLDRVMSTSIVPLALMFAIIALGRLLSL